MDYDAVRERFNSCVITASDSPLHRFASQSRLKLQHNPAVGFIDWLGGLQLLVHYVTGPVVPNTRAKHRPAQA